METITEDSGQLDSMAVAASVTVLITTTEDVGGNLSVRLCFSVYRNGLYSLMMFLQLTDDFLSIVDNLLSVSEETLQESQKIANSSGKLVSYTP